MVALQGVVRHLGLGPVQHGHGRLRAGLGRRLRDQGILHRDQGRGADHCRRDGGPRRGQISRQPVPLSRPRGALRPSRRRHRHVRSDLPDRKDQLEGVAEGCQHRLSCASRAGDQCAARARGRRADVPHQTDALWPLLAEGPNNHPEPEAPDGDVAEDGHHLRPDPRLHHLGCGPDPRAPEVVAGHRHQLHFHGLGLLHLRHGRRQRVVLEERRLGERPASGVVLAENPALLASRLLVRLGYGPGQHGLHSGHQLRAVCGAWEVLHPRGSGRRQVGHG
mmetsp:Transcript_112757/g.324041  ORF Transcript_112757/g.324041 Transcript_112757/m.324041 type:complete len:278 (-) Transcript_112757:969-1802(-)